MRESLRFGVRNFENCLRFDVAWQGRSETDGTRMFNLARQDVNAATDSVLDRDFERGAFGAQQAAENAMKAFLLHRGVEPPRRHDLARLLTRCAEFHDGVRGLDRYLAAVSFDMGVRHGEHHVDAEAAVAAVRAAIHIVGNFAGGIRPVA